MASSTSSIAKEPTSPLAARTSSSVTVPWPAAESASLATPERLDRRLLEQRLDRALDAAVAGDAERDHARTPEHRDRVRLVGEAARILGEGVHLQTHAGERIVAGGCAHETLAALGDQALVLAVDQ